MTDYEQELDLKIVIWKLLSQWKAVLIVAVIFSVLVAGCKLLVDKKTYNEKFNQKAEAEGWMTDLTVEERTSAILNLLSPGEVTDVMQVLNQEEMVEQQRDYLNNSIWINTNPAHQRTLNAKYLLKSDEVDISTISEAYNSIMRKDDFGEKLRSIIDAEASLEYIYELYSVYNDNVVDGNTESSIFVISVILPDNIDAKEVVKLIDAEIEKEEEFLDKNVGENSIQILSTKVNYIYNTNAVDRRKKVLDIINDLNTKAKNAKTVFSERQAEAYESIKAMNDTIKATGIDGDNQLVEDTVDGLEVPNFSTKYALLGFIIGVCLYTVCYMLYLVYIGCVNGASDIEGYTNARLLGDAYFNSPKKNFLSKLLNSNLADRIKYRDLPDFETQVNKIGQSVEAVCKHADVKDIMLMRLTDTDVTSPKNDALLSIYSAISNRGIRNTELDVSEDFEEKAFLEIDKTILVIGNDTKVSKLGKIMNLCCDYDINVLGSIYISEM